MSEVKQRWIPTSERLPKKPNVDNNDLEKCYLVQTEYGDMVVARYTYEGYWLEEYQFLAIDNIVAWRELPDKYKAESEVEE